MLRIRPATAAAVAAVGLIACSSSSGAPTGNAASSARPACVPDGARIIKARGEIAFYRTSRSRRAMRWVCGPTGRSPIFPEPASPLLQIAGTRVAYVEVSSDPFAESTAIAIEDLAGDPDAAVGDPAVAQTISVGFDDFAKIGSLRLASDGDVAWTECETVRSGPRMGAGNECRRARSMVYVRKANYGGRLVPILDRGRRISLTSLRLRGRALTWINAGRRQRARL